MACRADISSDSDDLFGSFEERCGDTPLHSDVLTPASQKFRTRSHNGTPKFEQNHLNSSIISSDSCTDVARRLDVSSDDYDQGHQTEKPIAVFGWINKDCKWRSSTAKSDSEDDSDDAFEKYLESLKTPAKKKSPVAEEISDDDFIVNDSEEEEIEESDTSSRSDTESPGFYRRLQNLSIRPDQFESPESDQSPSSKCGDATSDENSDAAVVNPENHEKKKSHKKKEKLRKPSKGESFENDEIVPSEETPSVKTKTSSLKSKKNSKKLTKSSSPEKIRDSDAEFLSSLYAANYYLKGMATAPCYVKDFKKKKHELVTLLFEIFNRRLFENELPSDLPVTWNRKLTKTAGYCSLKLDLKGEKTSRIELSEKVCDSAERVRDTLCHEMCHAAVWLINGVRKGGHGPLWQSWSRRVTRVFPDMPVVRRCHSYEIRAKFVYRCQGCGQEVKRHSKSLDTTKKICGRCRGRFELFVQKAGGGPETKVTADSNRPPPKFAAFVKEHYSSVKQTRSGMSHKEVMGVLGEKFKMKLSLD